jgi:8-oxo-dGTP diphosphatase
MSGFHGAKAAILVGGRLLTLLRDDLPGIDWPGWWDLPGGGREGAETPDETILREIREEVGLDLPAAALGWRRSFPSGTRPGLTSWFFGIQEWRLVAVGDFLDNARAIPFLRERVRLWLDDDPGPG